MDARSDATAERIATQRVLLLRTMTRTDARPVAILTPNPPKNDQAEPRYGCGGCGALLLAGLTLGEIKARTGKQKLAIRCRECDTMNSATVAPDGARASVSRRKSGRGLEIFDLPPGF